MRLFSGALVALALITSVAANASHFRGGAVNAEVDANGLLTISQTSFWRKGTANSAYTFSSSLGNIATSGSTDTSDARFDVSMTSGSITLPGAGLYTYNYNSCCRVSGGHNFSSGSFDMQGAIFWDGSTATSPILFDFSSISNEIIVGQDYNQNLNAVGTGLTYDQALNIGINAQPPGFTIDPATGQMFIAAADTAGMSNSSADVGADYAFSGNIFGANGTFTQFDWVFDVVTQASNLAPNLNDIVINGLVGDTFNGVMTGVDPEGNALTWFIQSLIGIGINMTNFSFDPLTQAFSFNSSGLSAGTYIANIGANDGALNGFGAITFNLSNRPSTGIPEPSVLALLVVAFGMLRFSRAKKA